MNIERFKKIDEDRYPVLRMNNTFYTANEIYEEDIELPLSHKPDWALLKLRLEMKYNDGKMITITCSDGTFTPEQQIDEVRKQSKLGIRFMMVEQGLLEYLLEIKDGK